MVCKTNFIVFVLQSGEQQRQLVVLFCLVFFFMQFIYLISSRTFNYGKANAKVNSKSGSSPVLSFVDFLLISAFLRCCKCAKSKSTFSEAGSINLLLPSLQLKGS